MPAHVTRIGVFRYRNADGSERAELRLPDEVFASASLDSLALAPVTDGHPSDGVRADTWRQLAVGTVVGAPRADGRHVLASLLVSDAETIAKLDAGELVEVSCGYDCTMDETSGEYNGEKYDAIQRGIEYNHVALGPKGWARGGSSVRVLDGDETMTKKKDEETIVPAPPKDAPAPDAKAKDALPTEEEWAAAQARIMELEAKLAELSGTDGRKDSRISALEARLSALPAEIRRADARRAKAEALGVRCDGLDDRAVMVAAIRKTDASFDDKGRNDEYLVGRFEGLSGFDRPAIKYDGLADVDSSEVAKEKR